jgi:hypothetical protein
MTHSSSRLRNASAMLSSSVDPTSVRTIRDSHEHNRPHPFKRRAGVLPHATRGHLEDRIAALREMTITREG